MKKLLLISVLILFLTFTLIGNCDWLTGWDKRIELKIEDYAGDIGGSVTWFPATIFLKDANGDSTKVFLEVGANSRKTALTKNDGITELKGEIEDWSYDAGTPANSTAVIHTSADGWTINANTSVWLYYDKDHADNPNVDVINTAAGAAVWDGNFKTVHHMVDKTTSTIEDSTSANNDGTKLGAGTPNEVAGKVGQAQEFDGTEHIDLQLTTNLGINTIYTLEAIFKTTDKTQSQMVYCQGRTTSSAPVVSLYVTGSAIKMLVRDNVNTTSWTAFAINDATYYYVAGVQSAANAFELFVDGATRDTDTTSIEIKTINGERIGRFVYGDELKMLGIIDEVRLSNVVRSAGWIKGTYNSLWDTLFTYGSEETEAVGITWNDITITKWNGVTITTPINTQ